MPLTGAERQRRYRQKLSQQNPEKLLQQKRENLERTKKKYKKKADCLRKLEEEVKREDIAEVESLYRSDETPAIQDRVTGLGTKWNQVDPLSNPFDSAASYFNDVEAATEEFSEGENKHVVAIIDDPINDQAILSNKEKPTEVQRRTGIPSTLLKQTNYYKNAYFKTKYENAILERRRLNQEIMLRQKEHFLLTKKFKLELAILEKQM